MKLKNLSNFKYQFIKFELIKLRLIKKNDNSNVKKEIDQLEIFFKTACRIIFQYTKKKKTILFVGIPQSIQTQHKHIIKKTKHLFLSQSYDNKGLLSNNFSDQNKNTPSIPLVFRNFKRKSIDLIVILNPKSQDTLVKDSLKLKIPTLVFTSYSKITEKGSYNIPCELTDFYKIHYFFSRLLLRVTLKNFKK